MFVCATRLGFSRGKFVGFSFVLKSFLEKLLGGLEAWDDLVPEGGQERVRHASAPALARALCRERLEQPPTATLLSTIGSWLLPRPLRSVVLRPVVQAQTNASPSS